MKTTVADILENDEDFKNKLKAWLEDNIKGTYFMKSYSFILFQYTKFYLHTHSLNHF